jgi:Alr-MurF fusion protein
MHQYTIQQIVKIIKGKLIQDKNSNVIEYLLTDSRRIIFPENSIFFAIKGDRRDGHQFIAGCYKDGVRNFVVSEAPVLSSFPEANFILVKNTVQALQALAASHRSQFTIPVIGISGSNGKTIVKEWLYQLLEQDYSIVRSPKSYNSQIGVPLSIWQMKSYHNLGIFEAGISQPSEMSNLAKVIQPTIGIFTNIGKAHDEGFLNLRQKINEKLNLFINCEILIYSCDYIDITECLRNIKSQLKKSDADYDGFKTFTWSSKEHDADVHILGELKKNGYTEITAEFGKEIKSITIPFVDEAGIENAINCWMLMKYLKYDDKIINQRMSQLNPVAMRLELKDAVNNCSLINDSYNSDLSSLNIALDFLNQQHQHPKRTLILSDILQSGKDDDTLYSEVADMVKHKSINRFIGIGEALQKQEKKFNTGTIEKMFYRKTEDLLKDIPQLHFENETILLKGARRFEFERVSKQLEQKVHQTILEINLNAIIENLKTYQSLLKPKTKLMVMVKAFSYGSGSFEIANVLQFHKVDYLAVAYADEGIELRRGGITLPVMVMNPEPKHFESIIHYNLEPEIYNRRGLQQYISVIENLLQNEKNAEEQKQERKFPIHIELDTGMVRLGFHNDDLDDLVALLKANPQIEVKSVFSHLAASEDAAQDAFTKQQIKSFDKMSNRLESELNASFMRHIVNSAGISRFPDAQFDMVRLGIGLYGIDSSEKVQGRVKNVSTLKSTIAQINFIHKNETIGYNRMGHITRDSNIATVNIGYADGLNRRFSNGVGKMLIRGKLAPIIGNVCMDMTMVDVTDIADIQEGDEVIVFGDDLPVKTISEWIGTIPYEIISTVSQRVKRVYFHD